MREILPKKWTKEDEALFSRFWSVIPSQSRVAKKYARTCWKRLEITETDMEHISKSLEKLAKSRQWSNGYAPQASTIINQQRWDDVGQQEGEPATAPAKAPACKSCHMHKRYHEKGGPGCGEYSE